MLEPWMTAPPDFDVDFTRNVHDVRYNPPTVASRVVMQKYPALLGFEMQTIQHRGWQPFSPFGWQLMVMAHAGIVLLHLMYGYVGLRSANKTKWDWHWITAYYNLGTLPFILSMFFGGGGTRITWVGVFIHNLFEWQTLFWWYGEKMVKAPGPGWMKSFSIFATVYVFFMVVLTVIMSHKSDNNYMSVLSFLEWQGMMVDFLWVWTTCTHLTDASLFPGGKWQRFVRPAGALFHLFSILNAFTVLHVYVHGVLGVAIIAQSLSSLLYVMDASIRTRSLKLLGPDINILEEHPAGLVRDAAPKPPNSPAKEGAEAEAEKAKAPAADAGRAPREEQPGLGWRVDLRAWIVCAIISLAITVLWSWSGTSAVDPNCQGKRPGQEYSRLGKDVEMDAIEASMETNRWWHNETNSRYSNAVEWRGMHAKCTACLNATFVVEVSPGGRNVGLFENQHASFPALVRFSNGHHEPLPDSESVIKSSSLPKDNRGMAVKLFNVPGKKISNEPDTCTVDLISVYNEVKEIFAVTDMPAFNALFDVFVRQGPLATVWHLLSTLNFRGIAIFRKVFSITGNPLRVPYNSVTPYRMGPDPEVAVKFEWRPVSCDSGKPLDDDPLPTGDAMRPDYLTQAVRRTLARGPACMDLYVKENVGDACTSPIEDATVEWPGPYVRYGRLHFPMQENLATGAQRSRCAHQAFNPWQTIEEHRPLGSLSRARGRIYWDSATIRRTHNSVPNHEPTCKGMKADPEVVALYAGRPTPEKRESSSQGRDRATAKPPPQSSKSWWGGSVPAAPAPPQPGVAEGSCPYGYA